MGIGHSFSKEYDGRKFCVGVRDLLGAPTDTIVNPANSGLSHGGGVAEQIAQFAGEAFLRDSRRVVGEYGRVPLTQAVITVAGNLPFKGIINAVGPRMTEPNVAEKLEQTITNCLSLADAQGWHSIGFEIATELKSAQAQPGSNVAAELKAARQTKARSVFQV
jgi:O-acetyl-ADP-ribose deacetylase (regulator of RNase III)